MKKDIVFCLAHKIKNMREERKIINTFSINNQSDMANRDTLYCFKRNRIPKSFQLRILFENYSFFQFRQIGNFCLEANWEYHVITRCHQAG